jgi:hypothetical protein
MITFYFFWTWTQKFISNDTKAKFKIIDRLHDSFIVKKLNALLVNNINFAKFNLVLTTLLIDFNIMYVIINSLINYNIKPLFLILTGIILRQICQFMNRLPSPENVVWFDPGFPTLLMVYDATDDFFFSGHTLTSLIAGMEIYNETINPYIMSYAIFFIIYEISFVIISKSHYFMDVYAAISTYFMLNYLYDIYIYNESTIISLSK